MLIYYFLLSSKEVHLSNMEDYFDFSIKTYKVLRIRLFQYLFAKFHHQQPVSIFLSVYFIYCLLISRSKDFNIRVKKMFNSLMLELESALLLNCNFSYLFDLIEVTNVIIVLAAENRFFYHVVALLENKIGER